MGGEEGIVWMAWPASGGEGVGSAIPDGDLAEPAGGSLARLQKSKKICRGLWKNVIRSH